MQPVLRTVGSGRVRTECVQLVWNGLTFGFLQKEVQRGEDPLCWISSKGSN